TCRFSYFTNTSAPVSAESFGAGSIGVHSTCPAMTRRAFSISAMVTRNGKLLEHDPEKWVPVFGKACPRARPEGSCSNDRVERDGDSKKSHLALSRPTAL